MIYQLIMNIFEQLKNYPYHIDEDGKKYLIYLNGHLIELDD